MSTEIISTRKKSSNVIKWLEALLSGKYKQTKEKLGDVEQGFCCWGLGCYITKIRYNPEEGWDDSLGEHIGFSTNGELKHELYGKFSLGGVNDDTNAGFKRISNHLIKYADEQFEPLVAKAIKKHFKIN